MSISNIVRGLKFLVVSAHSGTYNCRLLSKFVAKESRSGMTFATKRAQTRWAQTRAGKAIGRPRLRRRRQRGRLRFMRRFDQRHVLVVRVGTVSRTSSKLGGKVLAWGSQTGEDGVVGAARRGGIREPLGASRRAFGASRRV